MQESVKIVTEKFNIHPNEANLIFVLPALYVANADGESSFMECCSLGWNSGSLQLIDNAHLGGFQKLIETFLRQKEVIDVSIVANAINARLESFSSEESARIRKTINTVCTKVAKASGPLFREKVSAEERDMLDQIAEQI